MITRGLERFIFCGSLESYTKKPSYKPLSKPGAETKLGFSSLIFAELEGIIVNSTSDFP